MGDIVQGISHFFTDGLRSDCHIIFHFPDGFNYPKLIDALMVSFDQTKYKVTWEHDNTWATVGYEKAERKFGKQFMQKPTTSSLDYVVWFCGDYVSHHYFPFKRQWKGNSKGPILLALNHKDLNKDHPIINKFFSAEDNKYLNNLVDDRNFFSLGEHHSFENNLALIANCRYIIGIEGGWTHISHCMGAPMIVVTNERKAHIPYDVHSLHPLLVVIETEEMYDYLKLDARVAIDKDVGICLLKNK